MLNLITAIIKKPQRELSMLELALLCNIVDNECLRIDKTDTEITGVLHELQRSGYCRNTAKATENYVTYSATRKGQNVIKYLPELS